MRLGSKSNRCLVSLVTICLIPCLVGCDTMHEYTVTGHLWDSDLADNHHQAAPSVSPTFSRTTDGRDVLVEYSEANEKNDHLTHRAFLLYQNDRKVEAGKRPHFISASKANKLRATPLEIYSDTNAAPSRPPTMYAVFVPGDKQFSIVVDGYERGPFTLPAYLGPGGKIVRAMLTPATATCDVVIWTAAAATVIGIFAAEAYVRGHDY